MMYITVELQLRRLIFLDPVVCIEELNGQQKCAQIGIHNDDVNTDTTEGASALIDRKESETKDLAP